MRHRALACDYDGTLATRGQVETRVATALRALHATGRKLLIVTGRLLEDLAAVCPELDLFDAVVAENGALLHLPATRVVRALADPPPGAFPRALRARGVDPVYVGRVIVAMRRPHDTLARDVIRDLGLALDVVFNKDAVMVLPSGIDKGTGLRAALAELGISPEETVGVGDAENDIPLLAGCGVAVAVANALDEVKARADLVTVGAAGAGVAELCARIVAADVIAETETAQTGDADEQAGRGWPGASRSPRP